MTLLRANGSRGPFYGRHFSGVCAIPPQIVRSETGLFPQPDGFEGRCLVVKLAVTQDLSVAERDHDEDPAAHGCPTSRPATMFPSNHEYIVATVDESIRLGAVFIPLVEPLLPRFAHAVVPAVDAGIGPLRVFVPLDLGITG